MRWMSFNARIDLISDGEHAFSFRYPHILSFIKHQNPDVIGFQELSPLMLHDLKQGLTDYVAIGEARDAQGEANPIFIKRDYTIYHAHTQWYSGQRHQAQDEAQFPRTFTSVTFEYQGQAVVIINTHLSHISKVAREDSVTQLVKHCLKHGQETPIVLMGDFNSTPSETLLTSFKGVLNNVWDFTELKPTFHGFSPPQTREPIDYILYSNHWHCASFKVHNDPTEVFLSDHYPILAELFLKVSL